MMGNMHQGTLFPTNKNPGAPPEQIFFSDDIYVFKKFGGLSFFIGVSPKTMLTNSEDSKSLSYTNFFLETS
jgi:hypothetical protein